MTAFDPFDHDLRYIGRQDDRFFDHYVTTGELQLPLFDTDDTSVDWVASNSWSELVEKADMWRLRHVQPQ